MVILIHCRHNFNNREDNTMLFLYQNHQQNHLIVPLNVSQLTPMEFLQIIKPVNYKQYTMRIASYVVDARSCTTTTWTHMCSGGISLLVTSLQQDCFNKLTTSPCCSSGTRCGEQGSLCKQIIMSCVLWGKLWLYQYFLCTCSELVLSTLQAWHVSIDLLQHECTHYIHVKAVLRSSTE